MNANQRIPSTANRKLSFYLLAFLVPYIQEIAAQHNESIYQIIQLDSITIQASKNGFDINDFIDLVINDKSFYEAFHNLRSASYSFQNQILIQNDKRQELASYQSTAVQIYQAPCRSMKEEHKVIRGAFFNKQGEYKYYTAKLFDRLFFTHGTICIGTDDPLSRQVEDPKGMEKHVTELKKLLFTPGKKANIPLIGNKTAIFEKDMLPYYEYKIGSDTLHAQPCYVFQVQTKPGNEHQQTGKTVIKNLQTWFAKGNLQILKRKYTLEAKTLLYHFNVHMDIDVHRIDNKYYPKTIQYNGIWKVASKKKEHATFQILFSNFKN